LFLDVCQTIGFFTWRRQKATEHAAQASSSTASTSKLNTRSRESQAGTQAAQSIASLPAETLSLQTVKEKQALWEKAYDDLKTKENKFVDAYERILSRELKGGMSDVGRYWPRAGSFELDNDSGNSD
jgi:hypothetical protein